MTPVVRWLVSATVLAGAVGAGALMLLRGEQPEERSAATAGGLALQGMLAELSYEGSDEPAGPWRLELPEDHGAHPNGRAETWAVAAHLRGPGGEDMGIQVALLRVRLMPPDAPPRDSAWGPRALYRAHVTLFDGLTNAAAGEERLHRDVPGVAGHDAALREVWLDNWSIQYGLGEERDQIRLKATVGETEFALSLTPAKDAVALDPEGAGVPFRGYAITRMTAEGLVEDKEERRAVSGFAWLEHLWGDVPLPIGPIVWDRLQLQLDDGTDLSLTRTRRRDGGGTATVAGFAVGPDGRLEPLESPRVEMEPTRTWRGGVAGARYPLDWRLNAGELSLEVSPVVDDQLHGFVSPLWSGTVAAEGRRGSEPVSARGTMLLTASSAP
jgi:predicted secreted hydrolase